MKKAGPDTCEAWHLLVRFFFTQRATLPPLAAELQLSPAQCHVLNLIEPGRPMPMGRLAETLACDASNVTGLVDRLESRGLVRRRPSSSAGQVGLQLCRPSPTVMDTLTSEVAERIIEKRPVRDLDLASNRHATERAASEQRGSQAAGRSRGRHVRCRLPPGRSE